MSKQVSIILPMKNASPWIDECLESIIAQSFQDWELIVVNDHSTDNSAQIVSCYTDSRIQLFESNGNGIIDALGFAFEKSSGEFITRMDADDVMPDYKLELLLKIASKDPSIVGTGKVRYFGNAHISQGYLDYEQWLNERNTNKDHWNWLYRECVVASANWMTHRSNISFERNVYPEDYDLVFEWYKKRLKIEVTEEITHLWREHSARTSRNSDNYQQKAFFNLKLTRFVEIDLDDKKTLVLLGKNKKQERASRILNRSSIKHKILTAENIYSLEKIESPQILICVYPELIFRNELLQYLEKNELKMGSDFWFV